LLFEEHTVQQIPLREKLIEFIKILKIKQTAVEKDKDIKRIILLGCKYTLEDINLLNPSTMRLTKEQHVKIRAMKYKLKTWYSKIRLIREEKYENKALSMHAVVHEDNDDKVNDVDSDKAKDVEESSGLIQPAAGLFQTPRQEENVATFSGVGKRKAEADVSENTQFVF
jgi:hypothetical protein